MQVSPRLQSLVTHQLRERVVQEAELVRERSAQRAGDASPPMALLDVAECAQDSAVRTWAGMVPRYQLARALEPPQRHALMQLLTEAGPGLFTGGALAARPETVPLGVSLWRLASWLDSA